MLIFRTRVVLVVGEVACILLTEESERIFVVELWTEI